MDSSTKTAVSTPSSSPGLFSPTVNPIRQPIPSLSDGTPHSSPYLHPLQIHKVRETHKAQVEQDFITGRKLINQYEIINEIGRGVHGKVKLARSLETNEFVAIKIIQRFSKKRKLGKVTVSPEDKTKREIAILKKIRHPNVVGLLEVIDDPELKKIYMVLEHVELGEIVWRKKGTRQICLYERRRIEKETKGEGTAEEERFFKMIERRRQRKEAQRARLSSLQLGHTDYWSLEHGEEEDDAMSNLSRAATNDSQTLRSHRSNNLRSNPGSRGGSQAGSRVPSGPSSRAHTPLPTEFDIPAIDSDNENDGTPGPLPSIGSNHGSTSALDGSFHGPFVEDTPYRGRSPSMADSIISHMSSLDDVRHDPFEDDFSYVPCFTLDQARSTFRDTVLGLEYLHYQGVVHRDIKPANLLWTKDHRVKISDFGVSYFGKPVREGETEEPVSEADATDFDDDRELSKTVGTPAFFAPELCYTDLDVEQPKVTDQIDVWSLGVTLYCLVFARIPFLADDEWQLFRCIAKEDVCIPRRRLKAVDPSSILGQPTPVQRSGTPPSPYREENELVYEDIGDELHDLLRRMLIKDPAERMKLREVKRHPWVIAGISNVIGWLDDTDPSRKTSGRRIQVDRNELDHAVVPISFMDKARSAVKKAVGKVIGVARSETRSEGSRRRAASSATSSGTDTNLHTPITPGLRDSRRASVRGDESYFSVMSDFHERHREPYEHPLAQSLTASPDLSAHEGDPFAFDFARQQPVTVGTTPKRERVPPGTADSDARPAPPDRSVSAAASIQTIVHRGHSHSRSVNTPTISSFREDRPTTPIFTDHMGALFGGHLWHQSIRGREPMPDIKEQVVSRAQSVDRSLFESENKHSEPSVAISTATAPGLFQHPSPRHPRPLSTSAAVSPTNTDYEKPLASPLFFQHHMISAYQSASAPNVQHTGFAASKLDERPSTANRRTPEGRTPAARVYGASTPESFRRALETNERRRRLESDADQKRQQLAAVAQNTAPPPQCPPSPDDDVYARRHQEFQSEADDPKRAQSYSSVNSTSIVSQATSPSNLTSPLSSVNLCSQEHVFPSVPSLPALISGASSVSNDLEDDMLQYPGVVTTGNVVGFTAESTPETLTPPALSKESSTNMETPMINDTFHLHQDDVDDGYIGDREKPEEDDDDSDSDEGLTMMKRKPKSKASISPIIDKKKPERRGTNASVGSTETAKKVVMES